MQSKENVFGLSKQFGQTTLVMIVSIKSKTNVKTKVLKSLN